MDGFILIIGLSALVSFLDDMKIPPYENNPLYGINSILFLIDVGFPVVHVHHVGGQQSHCSTVVCHWT